MCIEYSYIIDARRLTTEHIIAIFVGGGVILLIIIGAAGIIIPYCLYKRHKKKYSGSLAGYIAAGVADKVSRLLQSLDWVPSSC